MQLTDIIADFIRQRGPISFHDFMEMALYYPEQGYYAAPREKIGEAGDFYTSPCLTGLFGDMIASQIEEMWLILGRRPFTVVECGAGTGLLCRDILRRLQQNPLLFDHFQYIIVEKSLWLQEKERQMLLSEGFGTKLRWASSVRNLDPVDGCFLSNELLDNFAVHQVMMEEQLMEIFVGYDNDFIEILRPASAAQKDYFRQLQITLPKGFRAEINLEATSWITDVSAALRSGFVLTIDYGHSAADLYSRESGTLACYHKHQVHHCPYVFVGEQDITAHVNFSALDHWGKQHGLEYCGYTNQTRFLQGLGLIARMHQQGVSEQHLRTLIDMGHKFKVLIQRKNLGRVFLSGLQFAQYIS